jgi:hypothetical protein
MPSKQAIISGLIVSALFMLVYNKVPAVKRALGGG